MAPKKESIKKTPSESGKFEDTSAGTGKFYYPTGATYEGEWILVPDGEYVPLYPPPPKPPPSINGEEPSLNPPPPTLPPNQVRPNRQRHGKGLYIDGAYEYYGDWQNDFMHGQGCFKYASGSSYDGNWGHNIYMGIGTYKWPNGAKYVGGWKNNKMHGDGTYIDKESNTWSGQFFNGVGPGLIMEIK